MPGRILRDNRRLSPGGAPAQDHEIYRRGSGSAAKQMATAAKKAGRFARLAMRRERRNGVIGDGAYGRRLTLNDMPGVERGSDDERGRVQEDERREDASDKPAPR